MSSRRLRPTCTVAGARGCASISGHFGVPLRLVGLSGIHTNLGEIRGRNAFLLHTALLVWPKAAGVVALGIHAGSGYRDCEPEFVDAMSASFDYHTGGAVAIATPFVAMQKGDVYRLARSMDVPLEITYSCESGDKPCGRCLSCRDRESLLARAL